VCRGLFEVEKNAAEGGADRLEADLISRYRFIYLKLEDGACVPIELIAALY